MPPITPEEVVELKRTTIPEEVFDAFNEEIAKRWTGRSAHVCQSDVIDRITDALGVSSQEIYDEHWLDVESVYEEAGWEVVYDKPAYNESYPATFTFSKASK